MADKEIQNPQSSNPQKPGWEQKPVVQPDKPMQQKPMVPGVETKTPKPELEKLDPEKKPVVPNVLPKTQQPELEKLDPEKKKTA